MKKSKAKKKPQNRLRGNAKKNAAQAKSKGDKSNATPESGPISGIQALPPLDKIFVQQVGMLSGPSAVALNSLLGALNSARQGVLSPIEIDQNAKQLAILISNVERLQKFEG